MPIKSDSRSLVATVAGAVLLACVSTVGDLVWYELRLPHRMIYGLTHGTLLCFSIGLYIGALARRPRSGAVAGAAIGLLSAGGYYALAPLLGPAVMFALWMALWMMMAALPAVFAQSRSRWRPILVRGVLAALGSGAAFYAVSGIWLERPEGPRNYVFHLVSWTIAYLPAFGAILCGNEVTEENSRDVTTGDVKDTEASK